MLHMPVVATAVNPNRSSRPRREGELLACVLQVKARLVSLNGGVVLALALLLSAFLAGALLSSQFAFGQMVLFGVLALAAWLYLLDSVTERLFVTGDQIERASLFGRRASIKLDDLDALLLVHEGLNQEIGIESLTARYRNGRSVRLPLGPCWRRRDLETFLTSVEQAMGSRKLVEEVR